MKEEKAKPKNITLSKRVMDLAEQIMDVRRFDDFSGMVQQLIREEWERRHGPMILAERPTPYAALERESPQSPVRPKAKRQKRQ